MNHITIICGDPIVEKLMHCITAELQEPDVDVVLLDALTMSRIPEFPGKRIIVFTASADPAYLTAAQEAGADGFWYLQPSGEDLVEVLAGVTPFPEKAPSVLLGKARSESLTKRELDVLRQMAEGKSDAQIGDALSISVSTVKHHIQQLRSKTGLANRTQLAVEAVRSGLIGK